MKEMTSELRSRLQDLLASAFDPSGLLRFATERLTFDDVKFADEVDFRQPKNDVVFGIVAVALEYGRLDDLIFALRDARPSLPDASSLIAAFGLETQETARTEPEPADSVHWASLRESVIRFDERLEDRRRRFNYLNAYKKLHDILHDLDDFLTQLNPMIDAIRRAADEAPDPIGILDPLSAWVAEAKASASKTEFPIPPPRWIARFEKAVTDIATELTKPDPATIVFSKIDRAAEILAHLPADEQTALNISLVQCAKRLETDKLIELIDRILAELGKTRAESAMTSELRQKVANFRILCRALNDWIADHDCCQNAESALQEAAGLPEITPAVFSGWDEMKAAFKEIADRRKGDLRADRVAVSANEFEEAGLAAEQAVAEGRAPAVKKAKRLFDRLKDRFRDLFFFTDKGLLMTTRDLLDEARTLNATLRSFQ